MTREDKQLLIQDLCVRLPYGVICKTSKGNGHLCSINQTIFGIEYGINIKAIERDYFNDKEEIIKPYLRPLSSMTDKEYEEFCATRLEHQLKCIEIDEKRKAFEVGMKFDAEDLEYLYSHHYDVRGLIPMGLANSTDKFNPYKD